MVSLLSLFCIRTIHKVYDSWLVKNYSLKCSFTNFTTVPDIFAKNSLDSLKFNTVQREKFLFQIHFIFKDIPCDKIEGSCYYSCNENRSW